MSARAIGSGTVSFGLVAIPIKVYSSGEPGSQVHFNLLHRPTGRKLKQQYVAPPDTTPVERSDMVRGYEFARGQYVILDDDEYKALQELGKNQIEIAEFVPESQIDPVFFDRAYYLGPDKGGDRAYHLLRAAMLRTGLVAVAKYATRGKQYLVLIRPRGDEGLVMHQLRYADEVKSFAEVDVAAAPELKEAELALAVQFIESIATEEFRPEKYSDEVKQRMLELIEQKVAGQAITTAPELPPQAQVIDLMAALRASLEQSDRPGTRGKKPARAAAAADTPPARKPARPAPRSAGGRGSGAARSRSSARK
jgi:DNA end-binding protein Ku